MADTGKISLLIIDSDADSRDILSRTFADNVDIQVADTAPNGTIGLMKALSVKPDVILLDALVHDFTPAVLTEKLLAQSPQYGIILTVKNGAESPILINTLKALEMGAFDFIIKPDRAGTDEERILALRKKLVVRIRAYSIKRYSRMVMQLSAAQSNPSHPGKDAVISKLAEKTNSKFKLLCIGISTGGTQALSAIIPQIPASFPLPVVIVIHLPGAFTASLVKELSRISKLKVTEASEGESITQGHIYIAHGGRHLLLDKSNGNSIVLKYSDSAPENNCRPSVDVLFRSASQVLGDKTVGLIMTGMGSDGAAGIQLLKASGGLTIAQDKETSVVWGMPGAAINTGCVDEVLALDNIILRIMELI